MLITATIICISGLPLGQN